MLQRLGPQVDLQASVAALAVCQGACDQRAQVAGLQGHELEDAAAAHQRLDHLEVRVLGGGADQDHRARLHPRQQRVLLRLVPAVHLVHEQDSAAASLLGMPVGFLDRIAQVLDSGQHGVDGDEVRAGGVGDDPRQGGLSGSGRSVEDDRGELVRLDRAAQQPARSDDVLLAGHLVQRARAHARGQRLRAVEAVQPGRVASIGRHRSGRLADYERFRTP